MPAPRESQLTQPRSAERIPAPARPPVKTQLIDHQWLAEYEKQKDSIFNYYSIENEVDFLKKTETLPATEREFYIEENVKRFLGEFVGKVPYTTIPYMLRADGFSYGGMHVMDSYRKAAEMGGAREKAETEGFARIEDGYRASVQEGKVPQTAIWISPPKIADYGFVFIMQPEENGKIKEYIVRYGEKQEEVRVSNQVLQQINPRLTYRTADEFLLNPQFLDAKRFRENLPALLQSVGVSEREIARSAAFEQAVTAHLGDWIRNYTDTIIAAAAKQPPPAELIDQAKSTLLAIYAYAQRLKKEAEHDYGRPAQAAQMTEQPALGANDLALAYLAMQQNAPTVTGGSCPVVRRADGLPGDGPSFVSNSDMLRSLANGQSIESLIRNKTFPCPKCGYSIPSGEGRTSCPKCGITKEQYAREAGGQTCD